MYDSVYLYTYFDSGTKKSDLIASNQKDYIGEITYHSCNIKKDASLFFADDNYFVLCGDEESGYTIDNCYMSCDIDGEQIYLPSPVPICIDYEMFNIMKEEGENELDYLYDNYTYEDAREFYERISKEYVVLDDEKQQITIDGFQIWDEVMVEDCVTLDFKNKIVIYKGSNRIVKVLDGTEEGE